MTSNFLLKKLVFYDFQGFFDAKKLKLFLEVCSKLFMCTDFLKNHLECILEKFLEAFGLFRTFLSV